MTARDDRIEALRLEIIEAQRPLLEAWSIPPAEKKGVLERVSERVKKLRAEQLNLIKEREAAIGCGQE